jgi:hypothetical protein
MTFDRRFWALWAVIAGMFGIGLSALLGGAFGTAAATGATPAAANEPASGTSASLIFGCRASVARVSLAGNSLLEPAVANGGTNPCKDDQSLVAPIQLTVAGQNLGTVGPADAVTGETGALGSTDGPAATSEVAVQALSLSLGGYTLSAAGPLYSQAQVACSSGAPAESGSSSLTLLTVTNNATGAVQTISLDQPVEQVLSGLPAALSALVKITANETVNENGVLSQRLLDIQLLGANGAQVIVGEAQISATDAGVCGNNGPITTPGTVTTVPGTVTTLPGTTTTITGANGTVTTVTTPGTVTTTPGTTITTGGSVPIYLNACATGSQLDPTTGNCEIYEANGQTIYVSAPFKGPSGGTVIPLSAARAKYKSACLSGRGPNYVLIVSQRGIHATGTPNADRIIGTAANVWVNALAGNDCVDLQGGGSEHLDEGGGNDRDYVLKGVERIVVGNGNDYINAERTSGWITAGNGNDRVFGGSGKTRIDLGRGVKHVKTGRSFTRLYTTGGHGQVSCGNKADTLWVLTAVGRYADHHGCSKKLTHLLH